MMRPVTAGATVLLDLATAVAVEAGALLVGRAEEPATGIASKSSRTDLVSDADRAVERAMIDVLTAFLDG